MIKKQKTISYINCFLSLGANLGDRERTLRKALELIGNLPETELVRISSFYETEPWGVSNQPDFINGAAHIRTGLSPLELLKALQYIEKSLGRVRKEHWGARTIDIDILIIEDVRMESEELKLPHPFLKERSFVLIPLAEIAENLCLDDHTIGEYLGICNDSGLVRKTLGSPMDFDLCLLACVDMNWALGKGGELLFHFPEDMRRFRGETIDNTVILGRRTFEGFPGGKPLERRRHIVLSRNNNFSAAEDEVCFVSDIYELWEKLHVGERSFVIGGAEVYRELLPYCREAHITFVESDGNGDIFLPDLDKREEFELFFKQPFRDEASGISMEFRKYRRK